VAEDNAEDVGPDVADSNVDTGAGIGAGAGAGVGAGAGAGAGASCLHAQQLRSGQLKCSPPVHSLPGLKPCPLHHPSAL